MKCNELQADLALYGDSILSPEIASAIEKHFETCPVCRAKNAANLELRTELRLIERVQIPDAVSRSLHSAISTELRSGRRPTSWFSTDMGEWLQMRLMPYAVGVLATVVIGLSVVSFMFTNARNASGVAANPVRNNGESGIMLASNSDPFSSQPSDDMIYPAEYARTRLAVSGESPSLNPQGSLVSLTRSIVNDDLKDDGVVVIADVFSNGLAQIREIVDPSNSTRKLAELEKALDADIGDAPFVPASLDQRSDSVRVVLRFQSVNVSIRENPKKRREN